VKVKLISVFFSIYCADEREEEEENPLVIEGYTVANAVSKLEANAQLTLQYLKYNNHIVNLKKTKVHAGWHGRKHGWVCPVHRRASASDDHQPNQNLLSHAVCTLIWSF